MFNTIRVVDVELRLTASRLTKILSHSLYIDNFRTFIGYSNRIVDGTSSRDVSQTRNDRVVRGLSFGYNPSKLILNDIDSYVPSGGLAQKIAIARAYAKAEHYQKMEEMDA